MELPELIFFHDYKYYNNQRHIDTLEQLCVQSIVGNWENTSRDYQEQIFQSISSETLLLFISAFRDSGKLTDFIMIQIIRYIRNKLIVDGCHFIRKATFVHIYQCQSLYYLSFRQCRQINNTLIRLVLQNCPNLQILILDDCHTITDAAFQSMESPFIPLVGLRSLQKISLKRCTQLNGITIQNIQKYELLLCELDLESCRSIVPDYIECIWPLLRYCSLSKLCKDITMSFQSLQSVTPLVILDISSCKYDDTVLYKVGEYFKRLLHFNCSFNNQITDNGIAYIINNCCYLTHLYLSNCSKLSSNLLPSMKYLCNIRTLDLSYTKIPNIYILDVCFYWEYLEQILLIYCFNIYDSIIEKMVKLCPHIKYIDATGCRFPTPANKIENITLKY